MRRNSKKVIAIRILVALAVTFTSLPSLGAVPQTLIYRTDEARFVSQTAAGQELNLAYIQQLSQMARNDLRMSVADFIPTNMSASDSESRLARQIIGHSIERWIAYSSIAKESLGEMISAVSEPLNQSVAVKDKNGISHKVDIGFKAARALASVTYTGIVDATLAYQMTSNTLGLEIARRLSTTQKLVVNHVHADAEVRETVAWRMEW